LKEVIEERWETREWLGELLSLGSDCEGVIDAHNQSFFISVSRELCDSELSFSLVHHFESASTISNLCDCLALLEQSACSSVSDGCSLLEMDFLASHFHELSDSFLNSSSFPHPHEILSNGSL
jgi:hypothetical protein